MASSKRTPVRSKPKRDGAAPPTDATLMFARTLIQGGLQSISLMIQEVDLTLMQLGTLILLQHRNVLSVSDVAKSRKLSLAATSKMLNKLAARGLVEREEDLTDRRRKRISLGREGVKLLARFDAGREQALWRLLQGVPRSLAIELERAVARVMAHVSETPPETRASKRS